MSTVVMQHYVPRVYLRKFATESSGSTPHVHCFDKTTRREFQVSINNIAGENYFYDIPEDPDQKFEATLSAIEGEFAQAYQNLLESENLDTLDENDRSAIAYTIAVQELRTREHRLQMQDMFTSIRKEIEDMPMTSEMAEQLDEVREIEAEEGVTRFQREFIEDHAWEFANILLDMKWFLYVNYTSMPFWTSDHPIVRHNHIDHSPYGSLGLTSKGIQLYFPLSPTVSLAFADPTLFNSLPDHSDVDIDHMRFQNSLQVRNSSRHVIANTGDFSMANDFITDYPQYGELDRNRVSID